MEIFTQRFLLRDFIPEDEPAFSAYRADPRYAEFCTAAEVTTSFSHELLQRFGQWAAEFPRRNYQLAIVDRRSPKLIGCAGLRRERDNSNWAELGIELAPQFWGRYAYAIEIAEALIEFGFRTLALQEIRGISVSANKRVTRLAQRYGFVAIAMPPSPDWMKERGWHQIQWQLTKSTLDYQRSPHNNAHDREKIYKDSLI